VIVDTLHFRGNFPQAVEIYAINVPQTKPDPEDPRWERITEKTPCQKDHEHAFPSTLLRNTKGRVYTHVKMVIIPDGGVKRLRVFGSLAI
jgi:allantoicase